MKKFKAMTQKQRRLWILITAIVAVLASVTLTLTLIMRNAVPLNVSGFEIDSGLYRYFVDTVRAAPASYGLVPGSPESSIREEANKLAAEYAAIELQFKEKKARLNAADKAGASTEMNKIWHIFGTYYQSIGVEKSTLMRVYENRAKRDTLFAVLYDTGGSKAVAEKDVMLAFGQNYIVFRGFSVPLTMVDEHGNNKPMAEADKKTLQTKFKNMLLEAQSGKDLNNLYSSYYNTDGANLPIQILGKTENAGYSSDFFGKVQKVKAGSYAVIESGAEIYILQRDATSPKDAEYFRRYRLPCLKILKGTEFDKQLAKDVAALKIDGSESLQKRVTKTVL
ncbi:MAG: hypothetical protein LBJ12_09265 [Oscillospiraceae bacterium]|jgi:hypothetical protein|nr:hypothetical protein [Oscillospiraceae bacterium]